MRRDTVWGKARQGKTSLLSLFDRRWNVVVVWWCCAVLCMLVLITSCSRCCCCWYGLRGFLRANNATTTHRPGTSDRGPSTAAAAAATSQQQQASEFSSAMLMSSSVMEWGDARDASVYAMAIPLVRFSRRRPNHDSFPFFVCLTTALVGGPSFKLVSSVYWP